MGGGEPGKAPNTGGTSPGGKDPGMTGGTTTKPGDMPNGGSDKPVPTMDPGPVSADNAAGQAVFRRMTLAEYKNTLRDLLGKDVSAIDTDLSPDSPADGGFNIGSRLVAGSDAGKFFDATDKYTTTLSSDLSKIVPSSCNLQATATGDQESCAKAFIESFGLRAFRRPLNDDEKQDLFDLFKSLTGPEAGASFTDALAGMTRAMVQTPMFLYHWELGEPATKDGSLVKYNSYEVASRLSYFLWATMPDSELFDAASAGKLSDPDDIGKQARRMLADPKAQGALRDFHVQWLDIDGMQGLQKDASYTAYNGDVAKAMVEESVSFATNVMWGSGASGKLTDLFTSTSSFLNAGLASVYHVDGVTGTDLKMTKLDPAQRSGILTQASFLAAHSDEDFSHPVKRGVLVLRHVVCNEIPDPKGIDVPILPERKPGETTREHFEIHDKIGGVCSGCHSFIDPIGFAFENYNAIGEYRMTEENKPVDATGKVKIGDKDVSFKDAVDFSKQLSTMPEVRACIAKNWMRYLLRRGEVAEEQGSVNNIMKAFETSEWDLREMLIASTTTRAFTHRKLIDGEATK